MGEAMHISDFFGREEMVGILPETILLVAALLILTLEIFKIPKRKAMPYVGIGGLAIAGYFSLANWGTSKLLFGGLILLDSFSTFFDVLFLGVGISAVLISREYLIRKGGDERGEYYGLILFATIGMMLMTRANDLIMVFLGLELLSIALYVLVGFLRHDALSNESGLKYLLLGAFSTGFFLFGIALVYGATGTTNFNGIAAAISEGGVISGTFLALGVGLLLVGFAFKVAVVPFHMWAPDVYQGAPTTMTAFLSTGPKAAGFGALLRVFFLAFPTVHPDWQSLMWVLAAFTMTVGNISALAQSNVKRMLAFSGVAHAGYLLVGVLVLTESSVAGVLFYLLVYSAMNLGAFAVVSLVEKGEKGVLFSDFKGLASRHPWLAAVLALFMISLAGFPPTAGFVAKYAVFSAAMEKGFVWLIVIAVLNTLVSVYYYVRLVVNMYMQEEDVELPTFSSVGSAFVLGVLALIIVLFGLMPSWLLDTSNLAARVIL